MAVSERRLAEAAQSLNRIRSADKREPDGSRILWHQGGDGVELLSFVDPEGYLERQDLSFFGEQIVWTREHGVRTGSVVDSGGSPLSSASELLRLDTVVSRGKLELARRGLLRYTGQDRYVLHLREMLERIEPAGLGGGFLATRSDIVPVGGDRGARRRRLFAAAVALAALVAATLALIAGR